MLKFSLLTVLLLLGNNGTVAMDLDNPQPSAVVTYKTIGDTDLKLHIFTPDGHDINHPKPAIVFFFGGGWKSGSPTQFYPHCEYLVSRGMVAISAEYRVESRNGTSPRECVMDGKSAMRWLRSHSKELGIDPEALLAGGGSAGGHVAAATATLQGFDEPGEDTSVSARPAALVLFNPVLDNGPDGYGYDRVKEYWQAFSPLHNISITTPPTIFFLGTEDHLIPVNTAEDFKFRMKAKGNRCDLYLYEGQPHGFFNYKHRENFDRTVAKMDSFLVSLGYLKQP